ncbi:MAG: alkaline phosphatase family protein [Candidatus Hodarchaeales archaeon]|jgi:predicted AlkP superfamily phosphohydrolase/phosphomutase
MSKDLQIIGLDGCDPYLLQKWIRQGVLPNFEKLVKDGYFGNLRSTTPPTTFPAWITMFTGLNPGKLGVFDFFDLIKEGSGFSQQLYTTRRWDADYLWSKVSQVGLCSGVVNVPFFTTSKLNGYMIDLHMSGSFPSNYLDNLVESHQYLEEFDAGISSTKKGEIKRISNNTEIELKIGRDLRETRGTDLFIQVFNILDSTAHCTISDRVLRDKYIMIDRALGAYFDFEGVNTLFVSDHGMRRVSNRFYLNKWLKDENYLKILPEYETGSFLESISYQITNLAPSLELIFDDIFSRIKGKGRSVLNTEKINWQETMAYAHSPNATGYYGIWLTEKGVLMEKEIVKKIMNIRIGQAKKLVRRCLKPHELYEGPHIDALPHLVLELDEKSLAMSGFAPIRSRATKSFAHSLEGIIIAHGPDISSGKVDVKFNIADVTPTALHLLGVPIPKHVDGQVVREILS